MGGAQGSPPSCCTRGWRPATCRPHECATSAPAPARRGNGGGARGRTTVRSLAPGTHPGARASQADIVVSTRDRSVGIVGDEPVDPGPHELDHALRVVDGPRQDGESRRVGPLDEALVDELVRRRDHLRPDGAGASTHVLRLPHHDTARPRAARHPRLRSHERGAEDAGCELGRELEHRPVEGVHEALALEPRLVHAREHAFEQPPPTRRLPRVARVDLELDRPPHVRSTLQPVGQHLRRASRSGHPAKDAGPGSPPASGCPRRPCAAASRVRSATRAPTRSRPVGRHFSGSSTASCQTTTSPSAVSRTSSSTPVTPAS